MPVLPPVGSFLVLFWYSINIQQGWLHKTTSNPFSRWQLGVFVMTLLLRPLTRCTNATIEQVTNTVDRQMDIFTILSWKPATGIVTGHLPNAGQKQGCPVEFLLVP